MLSKKKSSWHGITSNYLIFYMNRINSPMSMYFESSGVPMELHRTNTYCKTDIWATLSSMTNGNVTKQTVLIFGVWAGLSTCTLPWHDSQTLSQYPPLWQWIRGGKQGARHAEKHLDGLVINVIHTSTITAPTIFPVIFLLHLTALRWSVKMHRIRMCKH